MVFGSGVISWRPFDAEHARSSRAPRPTSTACLLYSFTIPQTGNRCGSFGSLGEIEGLVSFAEGVG